MPEQSESNNNIKMQRAGQDARKLLNNVNLNIHSFILQSVLRPIYSTFCTECDLVLRLSIKIKTNRKNKINNLSTYQYINISKYENINISTYQYVNISTYKYINI